MGSRANVQGSAKNGYSLSLLKGSHWEWKAPWMKALPCHIRRYTVDAIPCSKASCTAAKRRMFLTIELQVRL